MKTENTINTYGYCVIRSAAGFPLHIVEINHTMHAGFAVFSTAADARSYILQEINRCFSYGPLAYDPGFVFSDRLVKLYRDQTKENNGMFSKVENRQIYINPRFVTEF